MATAVDGLPSHMLAAEVHEFKKPYTIHQIETPKSLEPHDLLIKVAVASFCHTDMMILDGEMVPKPYGVSGSHEPVGTVVGMGSAVQGFHKGDRIAALGFRDTCGECEMCLGPEVNRHYCNSMRGFVGSDLPGAFQEYTIVDSRFSAKLPDELTFVSAAPLTCAGATAWRSLIVSGAVEGDWVGIVGSGGGLGHLAVQFAVKKGMRVVAIDAKESGLQLSKKAGAQIVLDARSGIRNVVAEVNKVTGGFVKTAIVLSDAASAVKLAASITRMQGTVVQVAQPQQVSLPFQQLVFRDIRLVGSLLASQSQLQDLVNFVAKHNIHVATTTFHGLHSLPRVLETARNGNIAGKLVVVVDQEAVTRDGQIPGRL